MRPACDLGVKEPTSGQDQWNSAEACGDGRGNGRVERKREGAPLQLLRREGKVKRGLRYHQAHRRLNGLSHYYGEQRAHELGKIGSFYLYIFLKERSL